MKGADLIYITFAFVALATVLSYAVEQYRAKNDTSHIIPVIIPVLYFCLSLYRNGVCMAALKDYLWALLLVYASMKDLEKSLKVIEEMYSGAIDVMTTGNQDSAKKIRKRREKVLDLDIEMRKGHMERVSKGKCAANMTASLNNILHSVDRMGNCCVNSADAALGKGDMTYFIEAGEKEGEQTNEQK